ncbi:DNA translocase FtsK [Methylotuvimicrobium alcaliphilum]|uniref:DNA translocase FtsK n=1 Tax=Methylotuvimicrobium alcaliphilum (strain DSM 19304 / NCIMB 14124 / VKM B-2133 / 20Z) TaxID=1091494 RepID=G4T0W1_META2|nr:DNA translocase FtsK [Methylotuvimicrobium alcaliphilum]CCE23395.1 DNA translocase ftsK [Methylotuvimicrobium alcaliphilum 20Z]
MSAVIEEKTFRGLREVALLGLAACALFFLISLVTFSNEDAGWTHSGTGQGIKNAGGMVGAWLADFTLSVFGLMAYLFPMMIIRQAYLMYVGKSRETGKLNIAISWLGFIATLMAGTSLIYLHFLRIRIDLPGSTGGILGQETGDVFVLALGDSGATLMLLAILLAGVTLFTGLSWFKLMDGVGKYTLLFFRWLGQGLFGVLQNQYERRATEFPVSAKPREKSKGKILKKTKAAPVVDLQEESFVPPSKAKQKKIDFSKVSEGELPPLSLLDERNIQVKGYSPSELEDMSRLVEEILQDFNVVAEVVAVHPGPVITRFELQPAAGVKVSRVSSLSKDLARALSVTSVRIVEVIPGKPYIGLEIPNQEREMVTLRELLASQGFEKAKSPLTLAMGKDISGAPVVADLGKMPHALVAGTTGSGKSVAINTMILSLLYRATPKEVRMIMIDPKMLELSVYEGIPHLLTPVVTDMKEASNALRWAVAEMERRYKLMSKMGVRNLAGFNQLINDADAKGESIRDPFFVLERPLEEGEEFPVLTTLPSIVIVIDELADMMMIVGKKVEELIARLAQKARAAGIHLILATQRPSVDVLTGLIKANVPTRISFQVSSRIDSRTILDQGGAETLLGNGDMLFLPSGTSIPIRAHGAFVDDHEVHRIVEFLKETGPADYLDEITQERSDNSDGFGGLSDTDSETDALYDEAVQFVTETRKASISSVQRRFKVGYNRAARMIEDMEAAGVVSPAESNGSREVLAPPPPKD